MEAAVAGTAIEVVHHEVLGGRTGQNHQTDLVDRVDLVVLVFQIQFHR